MNMAIVPLDSSLAVTPPPVTNNTTIATPPSLPNPNIQESKPPHNDVGSPSTDTTPVNNTIRDWETQV